MITPRHGASFDSGTGASTILPLFSSLLARTSGQNDENANLSDVPRRLGQIERSEEMAFRGQNYESAVEKVWMERAGKSGKDGEIGEG